MDLKAKLQKTKDAARVARDAVEAAVKAAYERGVMDLEKRLTEEVVVVCRDYCTESWGVAMDWPCRLRAKEGRKRLLPRGYSGNPRVEPSF